MPAVASNMENPDPRARQVVGVVKGLWHQTLDRQEYLSLLAHRLVELAQKEADPESALLNLADELESELDLPPIRSDGTDLRALAWETVNALSLEFPRLEIPGNLPERMPANNVAAQKLYETTDLEAWTSALLTRPVNPDR
jgi:hypothetical protein